MEYLSIEEINEERKRQKISVPELARRAGLPQSTVEKVLFKIVKNPRLDTVQAIERALGINNEPEQTDKLTSEERELLNHFRALNPTMRKYALEIIKAALSTQGQAAVETDKNIKFGG